MLRAPRASSLGDGDLVTELFRAAVSIAPTKRRRFWWVAWWTRAPSAEPFQPPDAFEGGAPTREAAKRAAERAAGVSLVEIEGKWARAWLRVREGKPPFLPTSDRHSHGATALRRDAPMSARAVLGVSRSASAEEITRAFRARVLEVHPDHGGDAASFILVKRAYDSLRKRAARRK